jgi:hypothetical protein
VPRQARTDRREHRHHEEDWGGREDCADGNADTTKGGREAEPRRKFRECRIIKPDDSLLRQSLASNG